MYPEWEEVNTGEFNPSLMAFDRGGNHSFGDIFCFQYLSLPSLIQEYSDSVLVEATSAHVYVTTVRLPYLFFLPPSFAQENCVPLTSVELLEKLIKSISVAQTFCIFCMMSKDI